MACTHKRRTVHTRIEEGFYSCVIYIRYDCVVAIRHWHSQQMFIADGKIVLFFTSRACFCCVSSTFSPFCVVFNCTSFEMIQPNDRTSSFCNLQVMENGVIIKIIQKNAMVLSFLSLFHLYSQLDNWFFVVKFCCVARKFVGKMGSRVHRLCQSINHIQFDATLTHAIVRRSDWLQLNANNSTAGFSFEHSSKHYVLYTVKFAWLLFHRKVFSCLSLRSVNIRVRAQYGFWHLIFCLRLSEIRRWKMTNSLNKEYITSAANVYIQIAIKVNKWKKLWI